jgi:O-antigen/teichoic acid export membrane protein
MARAGGGGPLRSALRRNLAANYAAQSLAVILNLACVPIFLHLLGPEQYGLIGFAVSLQAVLAILDLGLATTANREFSRSAAQGTAGTSAPVMLRTLEVVYFGMGVVIALLLALTAQWIADHWLQVSATPRSEVRTSLVLLGLATGLRWPVGLYSGVLLGLEHQVSLNLVIMARSVLRTAGAAAFLAVTGGTVVTYFACLVGVSLLEVLAVAWLAWRSQPARAAVHARFDAGVLRSFWSFSGELTLASVFAAVLKQEDKVVLARVAPLAALGHYTIASTLSSGLLLLSTPVFAAIFPRLSALLARGEEGAAAVLYHRASRLVAMLVAPGAAALMFFPNAILSAWTRSPAAAAEADTALSTLAFAMLLNACMQVPYALLLAAGLTRISLWINGLGVAALAPLLVVLVRTWGIAGAGAAWAIFNLGYFLAAPPLLHRRVLKGHLLPWLVGDILPFLAAAALCYGTGAWLGRHALSDWSPWVLLAGASVAYAAGVTLVLKRGSVTLLHLTGSMQDNGGGTGSPASGRAPAARPEPGVYDAPGSL